MAKRYEGRIVYVVRDTAGKQHFTLAIKHRGSLELAVAYSARERKFEQMDLGR